MIITIERTKELELPQEVWNKGSKKARFCKSSEKITFEFQNIGWIMALAHIFWLEH